MSIFVAILTITIATTDVCVSMTPDQLLVDDVWRQVSRQFVDPTFNGQGDDGWKRQRLKAIQKVSEFGPDEENKVYGVIRGMLNTLNDPYTRFLTPEQYETLTMAYTNPSTRATTEGGIGVQLIGDNKDADRGKVVVANIIAKSPAEKAGLRPGDSILFINGVDMTGATAEVVANSCRGENGTTVRLEIERSSTEIPATPSSATSSNRQTITVTRAPLKSTPTVEASTMIVSSRQTNEHSNIDSNSNANRKVGILKINTFTQETEQMVRQELQKFVAQDQQNNEQQQLQPTELAVSAIIIDLRSNLGGYMPAGVDVAKLFLPSRARIISEIDNTGRATIYINDGVGGSDTDTQLYVLVDRRSASASEILTAALQDNKRATVVSGESRTFGKGRIQNVQPVSSGGGGIAVTKARYVTPKGSDIQNVGIVPDIRLENCEAQDSATTCLEGIL